MWLDQWPSQRQELFDYLRDVQAEPDWRIPTRWRGVPRGTTVIVLDPGPYWAVYSHSGLAWGDTRYAGKTIYCAWRAKSQGQGDPPLPGLPHELRHLLTLDPAAGH